MAYNEIDALLTLDLSGVKTYNTEEEVYAARLYEWLNTYEGDIYGNPGWGNILPKFKHEPTNQSHVQVAIESRLLSKLQDDLPEVPISGILVEEGDDLDYLKITIQIKGTTITEDVKLSDEYDKDNAN